MAEKLTTADVLALTTSEGLIGIIYEIAKKVHEMTMFAASPIAKTFYQAIIRTALPTSGFRAINEGRVRDIGKLEQRVVECMYLDASWQQDKAIFSGATWVGGENANLIEDMQTSHLLSAFTHWAREIYYGNTASKKGFMDG